MNWFLIASVLPTKSWVSDARLDPSLLGKGTSVGRQGRLLGPGAISWLAPLPMRSRLAKAETNMSLLFLRLLLGLTPLLSKSNLATAGASVS